MKIMRYLLGLAFGTAGILHFTKERQFRSIVPEYLPLRKTAVLVTGVFEMFFGVMLLAKTCGLVEKGINAFYLRFSGNIYMARKQLPLGNKSIPKWALYLRLPLQFILIAIVKNYNKT